MGYNGSKGFIVVGDASMAAASGEREPRKESRERCRWLWREQEHHSIKATHRDYLARKGLRVGKTAVRGEAHELPQSSLAGMSNRAGAPRKNEPRGRPCMLNRR